jgi:uncharacterized membrane protein
MLGIAVGLVQLLRPKGGAGHRARGYAFVYAMLVADGAAMLIYQFTGKFNILHIGAIVNLVCIVFAVVPVLRSPRPLRWKTQHYYWMCWSYVGLLAAAATELVVRTLHFPTRGQTWSATAITSALVTVIGGFLISRYWPEQGSLPALKDPNVQHESAPS